VPDRHRIVPAREFQQDGIEHVLGATLAPLGAAHRRLLLAARGKGLAAELVAGNARAPYAVLPIVERVGRVAHCIEKPPAPAEFHGAHAHHVHLGLNDRSVGLLDQQCSHAAAAEIARKAQAYRACAHDQNFRGATHRHVCEIVTNNPRGSARAGSRRLRS
jgi:hypothetical protein